MRYRDKHKTFFLHLLRLEKQELVESMCLSLEYWLIIYLVWFTTNNKRHIVTYYMFTCVSNFTQKMLNFTQF